MKTLRAGFWRQVSGDGFRASGFRRRRAAPREPTFAASIAGGQGEEFFLGPWDFSPNMNAREQHPHARFRGAMIKSAQRRQIRGSAAPDSKGAQP